MVSQPDPELRSLSSLNLRLISHASEHLLSLMSGIPQTTLSSAIAQRDYHPKNLRDLDRSGAECSSYPKYLPRLINVLNRIAHLTGQLSAVR